VAWVSFVRLHAVSAATAGSLGLFLGFLLGWRGPTWLSCETCVVRLREKGRFVQRRLHIGGKTAKAGWEILDVRPDAHVDHLGNATDLRQFADATFQEIYASHVLEHFCYQTELLPVLTEWQRVLVPGGVLRLSVPDLDILAHLFMQRHTLDINQRFFVMRMMFGGHMHEYDHHRVGLNFEFMYSYLQQAGFVDMQRVGSHGLFNDSSETLMGNVPISLNMTAVAPATVAAPTSNETSDATVAA
jgi:predicted SAM-dependent methyltransferase